MSKKCWRKLIVLSALASLMSVAHYAEAQWGTNTTPCPTHCGPASPWWGYVQTGWNRWPGATYPDMLKAPGAAGEGVPVPSVDLPRPNKESEIRSTPSSDNKAPESAPSSSETPTESSSEPTPAKPFSAPKPMDMPSVKDAPAHRRRRKNRFSRRLRRRRVLQIFLRRRALWSPHRLRLQPITVRVYNQKRGCVLCRQNSMQPAQAAMIGPIHANRKPIILQLKQLKPIRLQFLRPNHYGLSLMWTTFRARCLANSPLHPRPRAKAFHTRLPRLAKRQLRQEIRCDWK